MFKLLYFLFIIDNYVFCINSNLFPYDPMLAMKSSVTGQHPNIPNLKVVEMDGLEGDQIKQTPNIESFIEILHDENKRCDETETLMSLITMLLNLVRQDPNYSGKLSMVFKTFKVELMASRRDGTNCEIYDKLSLLEDKLHSDQPILFTNGKGFIKSSNDHSITLKRNLETKVVFKYQLPHLDQPKCKAAFLKLLQTAYKNYINLPTRTMCIGVEEYENPRDKSIRLPLNPYSKVTYNSDNPANIYAIKTENHVPNDLHSEFLPNEWNVKEYSNNIPFNELMPQNTPDNMNNVPNISPTDLVLPVTAQVNQKSVHEIANSYNPDTYDVINHEHSRYPGFDENYSKNNINLMLPNINSAKDSINSFKLHQNTGSIPASYNNLVPKRNNGPSNDILGETFNTKAIESQRPSINIISPIVNSGQYDKVPGSQKQFLLSTNLSKLSLAYDNIPNQHEYGNLSGQKFKIIEAALPKNIVELIIKFPQLKEYFLNIYSLNNYNNNNNLPNIQISNTLNANDYYRKLYETLLTLTNLNKHNTTISKPGVVELTYVVKQPEPVLYHPLYYVKYGLAFEHFTEIVSTILKVKPYLRTDPAKLFSEIIAVSNVIDSSPDLKDIPMAKLLQLTYASGRLVKTQVLPNDDEFRWKNNLKSNIDAREIVDVNKSLMDGTFWKSFNDFSNNAKQMATAFDNLTTQQKKVSIVPGYYSNQKSVVNGLQGQLDNQVQFANPHQEQDVFTES